MVACAAGLSDAAPMLNAPPPTDPRYGLLTPMPDRGGLPPLVELLNAPTETELAHRARVREYTAQIRAIRHKYFGGKRLTAIRSQGIAELREFTDAAALRPMWMELRKEQDDVRLAVLDHLAALGADGQAALAWAVIYHMDGGDAAIRHEAVKRLSTPASPPVLAVLDSALRSNRHAVVNQAGALAGTLNALETIPLLIVTQVAQDTASSEGDLAWIAIQTQTAYTQRIEAVVGDGAAAFVPVIGILNEGVVLRAVDAVVISYRTDVHRSLVAMTSHDWGRSTEHLAYDVRRWWEWYNREYVPFRNEQAREAAVSGDQPAQPVSPPSAADSSRGASGPG
jgi:hypothetical protein